MIPCIRNSGKFKITVRESRLGIARRWEEVGRGGEAQEYLGVTEMFSILNVVEVTQLQTFVKTSYFILETGEFLFM